LISKPSGEINFDPNKPVNPALNNINNIKDPNKKAQVEYISLGKLQI